MFEDPIAIYMIAIESTINSDKDDTKHCLLEKTERVIDGIEVGDLFARKTTPFGKNNISAIVDLDLHNF